jgi:outer membrane protein
MKKIKCILAIIASTLLAQHAVAFSNGDIITRADMVNISLENSSVNIFVNLSDANISNLRVSDDTQIGLNFSYEVVAATPSTHDIDFGSDNPLETGSQLDEVTHLPPRISINYYFNEPSSALQSYVDIGVNYKMFYEEELTSTNKVVGLSDVELDALFNLAAKINAYYMLSEKWFVNASSRYVDIDTEASFNLGTTPRPLDDIDIEPMVTMFSIGYVF